MRDLSTLKFVEIGVPWVKTVFPEQTVCFSPYHTRATAEPEAGIHNISLATLPTLNALLRDPAVSLVICRPLFYPPWHWQWIAREVLSRRMLRGQSRLIAPYAAQLLRQPMAAPLAVLDSEDFPGIKRDRHFLLERCCRYFKRELPPDRWRLFMGTGHPDIPSRRFRGGESMQRWIDKIAPISIGLPASALKVLPLPPREKTTDVFFVGDVERSSTVRSAGMKELLALRQSGMTVDIPQTRLPPEEFYRRAAAAWLIWSPEGLGWDCFRHYEALACGSVPVTNLPTIERHRPLAEGRHAFYYDPAPGRLAETIRAALADKTRLLAMARDGQAHVMANHTPEALVRYVIETSLDAAAPAH
jgi:hypothetical protein